MKTLLLMRHAKSSWKFPELSDHDRPLNKRGQHDAPMMGRLLVERELVPQRIVCSSAVRTRQTAEAVVDAVAPDNPQAAQFFSGDVVYLDRLYLAEAEDILAALREQPDEIERLMVIGHNPGLETLLQMLSGRIESLPTAVIAHIALPVQHWSEISGDTTGELIDLWRPKELREEEEKGTGKRPTKKGAAKKDKTDKDKGKSKNKHKDKPKDK